MGLNSVKFHKNFNRLPPLPFQFCFQFTKLQKSQWNKILNFYFFLSLNAIFLHRSTIRFSLFVQFQINKISLLCYKIPIVLTVIVIFIEHLVFDDFVWVILYNAIKVIYGKRGEWRSTWWENWWIAMGHTVSILLELFFVGRGEVHVSRDLEWCRSFHKFQSFSHKPQKKRVERSIYSGVSIFEDWSESGSLVESFIKKSVKFQDLAIFKLILFKFQQKRLWYQGLLSLAQ